MQSPPPALKRLVKEVKDIRANPVPGIVVTVNPETIFKWTAKVFGPNGSPYEGGTFVFQLEFTASYPFKPPTVKCRTRVFHCNINTIGDVCLDIIKNRWTPLMTGQGVLLSIQQLLGEPNPEDPLMLSVAKLLKNNPEEHNRRAKLFTLKYAK